MLSLKHFGPSGVKQLEDTVDEAETGLEDTVPTFRNL